MLPRRSARASPTRRAGGEEQGDHDLQRAYATENLRVRERHFGFAIDDLRHARQLYYQELEALEASPAGDLDERIRPHPEIKYALSGPIPKGRRDALSIEIDRLSTEIEQLFRERPVDPPPPVPISEKLVPKLH